MTCKGLTWDHPRGYDGLAEAARRVNEGRKTPLIEWDTQPLEGFESAPICELAQNYDLLVLDHPHIGEAVAENCLAPLETYFSPSQIDTWAADTIGPAFASYRWGNKAWAMPLDVAAQVMARRPDRISNAPESWDEVLEIAARLPVAQSLSGPHALMTFYSIVGGKGVWPRGDQFMPEEAAINALELMHRLFGLRPAGSEHLNPIKMLKTMSQGHEIALIPLVFGYVNYTRPGPLAHPVAFTNSIRSSGGSGGVLGGTGIGFSRRFAPSPDLLAHIAGLMRPETQAGLLCEFGGQPSARSAWADPDVNAAWGNFYAATAVTAETALLRPRFDGCVAFQTAAGDCIRDALEKREDEKKTLAALRALWTRARDRARGDLDDDRTPNA